MKKINISAIIFMINMTNAQANDSLNFGIFANPMIVAKEAFALPMPAGVEISIGMNHLSGSMGYSILETPAPMIIREVSLLYKRYYKGNVLSVRGQYYSGDSLMTGIIGEIGAHTVFAHKMGCFDSYGCERIGFIDKNTFDGSLDAGYGFVFGEDKIKFNLYALAGYRYQILKTRNYPMDARIGIGLSL